MRNRVRRLFVEKKKGYDVEAQALLRDLRDNLGINGLTGVRVINRYDVQGMTDEEYDKARGLVFSEPPVDELYDEAMPVEPEARTFAVEYLPGQYDQRADCASQCVQILTTGDRPECRAAKLIILDGKISDAQFDRIKAYCINPVECREASLEKPLTLEAFPAEPCDERSVCGFTGMSADDLGELHGAMGLAMSPGDLAYCQAYFRDKEKREPTITEIRVLDTYWSDHCRHTTFLTGIDRVDFEEGPYTAKIKEAYRMYLEAGRGLHGGKDRAVCLMDIATAAMKELRAGGLLEDLDESEEINACSIKVRAEVDGKEEDWLIMFKNETHNHPTEIEPFGGAATCLGGAIRDPLSGRAYVYQAMRVTGSGDPRARVEDTIPGKLPQRKITTVAAAGYSSYGNQIGLATGQVAEVYHPGFVAKRMEIGAVIGAAPRGNVVRIKPQPGDVVILLGGRTGRDGCGGATGSSKAHTEESLATCGAEVQKGNPPTERKIQRLFRKPEVSRLIKRCNDFGAGGVSVAIGELADGLEINLDAVPKKYEGLDGTELAISESQERMAVVVAEEAAGEFIKAAGEENLEAVPVARVTAEARLRMSWRGKRIVNISRDFLNTNGVAQSADVYVASPGARSSYFRKLPPGTSDCPEDMARAWLRNLGRLNVCSQRGLVEMFDSTIGSGTVLMPFGGSSQATPAEGMASRLPVAHGATNTGTLMAFGYNPELSSWSPFHGAVYSIVEACAKIAAMGGDYRRIRLTLQEYFEKPGKDPARWGKPFSALLGAFYAQKKLGIPAIGGKDSMSGTFKELDVPPTLVAFAVSPVDIRNVVSAEFKRPGSTVVLLLMGRDELDLPDFENLQKNLARVSALASEGRLAAVSGVREGGIAAAISRMCFGNEIGFKFCGGVDASLLFKPAYGSLVLEVSGEEKPGEMFAGLNYRILGHTQEEKIISLEGVDIPLDSALRAWEETLESVFPTRAAELPGKPRKFTYDRGTVARAGGNAISPAKPRIFMPVFPGTNCEYDTARAFERAGGLVDTLVIRNLSSADIEASIRRMTEKIKASQIIMLPGGFSGGDEPDGSGKFIAAAFRNPHVSEAVMELLRHRDGLILGICNGFQALIKLGLVPYGEIRELAAESPTLTFNTLGRHVSRMVRTRVSSNLSPWLSLTEPGEVFTIPVSHGEGRFVAGEKDLSRMAEGGQVATQYVDPQGEPTYDIRYNPNGSVCAIEGITSPDGRVLGKMGHSERAGENLAKNIPGNMDQRIFEAGVAYFK